MGEREASTMAATMSLKSSNNSTDVRGVLTSAIDTVHEMHALQNQNKKRSSRRISQGFSSTSSERSRTSRAFQRTESPLPANGGTPSAGVQQLPAPPGAHHAALHVQ